MEKWDAYDAKFRKVEGVELTRGQPVPEGLFHLVCIVLVRHTDGTYLLMQRDQAKPLGGMWEATAHGAALAGETPLQCATRELWEETGIEAKELVEATRTLNEDKRTISVYYLCVTGLPKDGIILQPGETADYRWVSREELLALGSDVLVSQRMKQFVQ